MNASFIQKTDLEETRNFTTVNKTDKLKIILRLPFLRMKSYEISLKNENSHQEDVILCQHGHQHPLLPEYTELASQKKLKLEPEYFNQFYFVIPNNTITVTITRKEFQCKLPPAILMVAAFDEENFFISRIRRKFDVTTFTPAASFAELSSRSSSSDTTPTGKKIAQTTAKDENKSSRSYRSLTPAPERSQISSKSARTRTAEQPPVRSKRPEKEEDKVKFGKEYERETYSYDENTAYYDDVDSDAVYYDYGRTWEHSASSEEKRSSITNLHKMVEAHKIPRNITSRNIRRYWIKSTIHELNKNSLGKRHIRIPIVANYRRYSYEYPRTQLEAEIFKKHMAIVVKIVNFNYLGVRWGFSLYPNIAEVQESFRRPDPKEIKAYKLPSIVDSSRTRLLLPFLRPKCEDQFPTNMPKNLITAAATLGDDQVSAIFDYTAPTNIISLEHLKRLSHAGLVRDKIKDSGVEVAHHVVIPWRTKFISKCTEQITLDISFPSSRPTSWADKSPLYSVNFVIDNFKGNPPMMVLGKPFFDRNIIEIISERNMIRMRRNETVNVREYWPNMCGTQLIHTLAEMTDDEVDRFFQPLKNFLIPTANDDERSPAIPVSQISGVLGESVRLPCDISVAEGVHREEDNIVLVLWYREDLGTPIYSVDVREKDFSRAEKWWEENVLNNRAYFEVNSQSTNLVIDHVVEKDAAMYRCRVDFKYAQTRNSKVNLTIIVPPEKVVILDERNVARTTVVGPYSENSDLTLICQVFNGKPLPYIMWYKNAELLSNVSANATLKNGVPYVESIITVRRLQRSDLHSQLTCAAANTHLKAPITAVVQVDMNFGPLDVKIIPDEQPLTAQRKHDLICESTGSRPPAKLTWWKNNFRLEKTKDTISSDGNTTRSILTYIPTKDDKNKYLSCKAENPVVSGGKTLETGWRLKIHYTPETKIILGTSLKQDSIKEGMDVYFDCIVNAFPPIYKVEWRKNNKPLQQMKGVIISNQSLVLQSVTRSSAGNYSCIGFNSEGDGISDPFYLNVMYAPFCKPNQTRVYGIAKNELVNITCEVEANPVDLTFRWKFNNSAENDELPSVISKPGATISVISHMPLLEVDYGTLLCLATNKVGRQRVPCVFHVIAAARPDPVSNCTVNNISLNSFSIRCTEGFNGGLPQTFSIAVTEQRDPRVINSTSPSPAFTISGLQPGTSYSVSVISINAKGHSEPYQLEILTQGKRLNQMNGNIGEIPPEKQQGNFHVTATMSIIIGAVISLLTIVCIVASVFKIQCSKSRSNAKSRNQKRYGSNGNLAAADKNFSSPIHSDEISASVCPSVDIDSDDKNPDIIPQPVTADIDRLSDTSRKKQHISTIENRYMQNRNFLQFSNATPTNYSGYCTLRTGIVPLQDFCHLNTKTTSIHGDLQYLSSSSGTLNRHQWPTYSGTIAGVQSHQCAYQLVPNPTHQQAQTQTPTPPSMIETTLPNTSLAINKQESTV